MLERGFPVMLLFVRRGFGNEAEGCVFEKTVEQLPEKAMDEMEAKKKGDAGARGFRQSTRKTGLNILYYRRAFRENEVSCSALVARELLWWKGLSAKFARYDAEQRTANAGLERCTKYYEGPEYKRLKRERAGDSTSGDGKGRPKVREMKSKCRKKA